MGVTSGLHRSVTVPTPSGRQVFEGVRRQEGAFATPATPSTVEGKNCCRRRPSPARFLQQPSGADTGRPFSQHLVEDRGGGAATLRLIGIHVGGLKNPQRLAVISDPQGFAVARQALDLQRLPQKHSQRNGLHADIHYTPTLCPSTPHSEDHCGQTHVPISVPQAMRRACARPRCTLFAPDGREQRASSSPSPPLEERAGERRPFTILEAAIPGDIPMGCRTIMWRAGSERRPPLPAPLLQRRRGKRRSPTWRCV
jgi:hypothetical protein